MRKKAPISTLSLNLLLRVLAPAGWLAGKVVVIMLHTKHVSTVYSKIIDKRKLTPKDAVETVRVPFNESAKGFEGEQHSFQQLRNK